MAASRITTRAETFPCTSHTSCLSLPLSPPLRRLGIVHNETRYPRLVSRPIKQLGSAANREVEKSDYNDLEHWPSIEETTPWEVHIYVLHKVSRWSTAFRISNRDSFSLLLLCVVINGMERREDLTCAFVFWFCACFRFCVCFETLITRDFSSVLELSFRY